MGGAPDARRSRRGRLCRLVVPARNRLEGADDATAPAPCGRPRRAARGLRAQRQLGLPRRGSGTWTPSSSSARAPGTRCGCHGCRRAEHWGWYVNLQLPFRRTELGFETMDLVLDLIVDPDGSWRWKEDEDELGPGSHVACSSPELGGSGPRGRRDVSRPSAVADRLEECAPRPAWGCGSLPTAGMSSVGAHHGGRAGHECEHDRVRTAPVRGNR